MIGRHHAGREVRVPHDHTQQVVEVVCNPARKNAEALKPLRVPQLFFRTLLNRDIDPDSDEPRRLSGIIHKSSTPDEHPARLLSAMRISKLRLEKSLILLAAGKNLPHGTCDRRGESVRRMPPRSR